MRGEKKKTILTKSIIIQGEKTFSIQFLILALITHTMVHHSLSQVLIRQEWEASLPNVGLNKFVRVASIPRPIPKANNT